MSHHERNHGGHGHEGHGHPHGHDHGDQHHDRHHGTQEEQHFHHGPDQHHHHQGEPRHQHGGHGNQGDKGNQGQPGPRNVDLELSQMLGDHATGMTRDIFMEVLKDSIKDEIKKMPELTALVSQAARELSEDIRLSLQIENLIAERDKKRESRKSDLLSALIKAGAKSEPAAE